MTASTDDRLWAAPVAAEPVVATVRVPGSKSVTNRALVLAALADAPSAIRRPLVSRDTELMAAGLRVLGVGIRAAGDDVWHVDPPPTLTGGATIDVGLAGTVMRFLPPVATLATGAVGFDGDARARERPMSPLIAALRALGADVDDGGRGTLPVVVHGRGALNGGAVRVDASMSSQVVSALLLTGPRWETGVQVAHVGERPVPNAPHVAMTVAMLRERGVLVDDGAPAEWSVKPGGVQAVDTTVEPDLSSAAPFLAAAVVTGGRVVVPDWPTPSFQPGALLPGLLEQFGARCVVDDEGLVVTAAGPLHGADLDLRDAGELTPVLASVAAVAGSPSRLTGIGYLRGHESDRLAALSRELGGLGAQVSEEDDGLRIAPGRLHGGVFRTHADHRLAMAAAVLGLVVADVQVEDVATTDKTFPGFAGQWQAMVSGAGVTGAGR